MHRGGPRHSRVARAALLFAGALAVCCVAAASQHAEVQRIDARVVGIQDGDTVTILAGDNVRHRVRLAGIDAPELGQPFGRRSRESLSAMVFAQPVRVEWRRRDPFGRLVGTLWVAPPGSPCRSRPECPATLDAALAQLERGHAWWFRRYAPEQPPEERARYEAAEREAREQRLGLWRDREPVPPWAWRRRGEPRQPLVAPAVR